MNNSISIHEIGKTFGQNPGTEALKDINLEVPSGALFGLIGPDGAGKSTLFRILTSLLLADQGTAKVMGYDVVSDYKMIRKLVGYMPGKFSLYQDLSVEENLHFFATIFNTSIQENYTLIEDIYVQLEPFKKRRAGALSGGMKQKLALCCALVHEPRVLFLDEPTTGVDAVSRKEFWEMLKKLKKRGITIFVSTPYMDEASMCDEIALIQNGTILTVDQPERLMTSHPKVIYGIRSNSMFPLYKELQGNSLIDQCYSFGMYHHIQLKEGGEISKIAAELKTKGFEDLQIKELKPSVEDVFIDLMDQKSTLAE
jgi:ABC-type multidrug transport system ATPase subunit